tara:strand:- start:187 stop:483 length:297 start_codon:yes stop_codon:yes gene_type:complete
MLKSEIIEKLQTKHTNLSNYDIELILKIFFKKIISSLNDGNTIEIRGFGTFKKKINKEKQVRNPKNNQLLFKNKTFKLHFKTGKTLHKKLNNIKSEDD